VGLVSIFATTRVLEEDKCPICLCSLHEEVAVELKVSGHSFHEGCLGSWANLQTKTVLSCRDLRTERDKAGSELRGDSDILGRFTSS
jgi:hypothetical protein